MPDSTRFDASLRVYLERLTQRAEATAPALMISPADLPLRSRRLPQQLLILIACTAVFAAVLGAGLAIRLAATGNRPAAPAVSAPAPSVPISSAPSSAASTASPAPAAGCPVVSPPTVPVSDHLPSPRGEAAMASDPRDCSVLLFGGSLLDAKTVLGDTWRWADGVWTQLHPLAAPPPRVFGAMAFDPATSQMVLYGGGGANTGDPDHGDTWTWDGSAWSQQHPATSPPRGAVALAYDKVSARLLLLWGTDTWTWDGRTWLPLAGNAPLHSGGAGSLMVADPAGSPFLFDMDSVSTRVPLGVYRWHSGTWIDATPAGPGPICIAGASVDASRTTITVVGCDDSQWRYLLPAAGAPSWQRLARPPIGQRRWVSMITAPDGLTALLFGGVSNDTTGLLHNDLWSWDGARWARLIADRAACTPGAVCH